MPLHLTRVDKVTMMMSAENEEGLFVICRVEQSSSGCRGGEAELSVDTRAQSSVDIPSVDI